jgi:hypothetical protein
LITATRLPRVPLQRFGFLLSRSPNWLARIFDEQALRLWFKTFNFLHTARWVSLGRFPYVAREQPREPLGGPRWVLYIANYDGAWDPYFGAFMEAMGEGVYDIWGQSIGYPGFPAAGTANDLRAWLQTRLPENQHYYAAYPWATANDVRAALRVRREVLSVALELRARPDVTGSTDASLMFDDLVRRIRDCLGPIEPQRWPPPEDLPVILPDGGLGSYVAVFPLQQGCEERVRAEIKALPPGNDSPFRRVPGVHFARLALLDRTEIGSFPNESDNVTLRNSYLLFAADFDGLSSGPSAGMEFVGSVFDSMPEQVSSIWQHCWGFEHEKGRDSFLDLASRCRCPTLNKFLDCPAESLGSVLAALAAHESVVMLARRRSRGDSILAEDLIDFLGA